MKRAFTICVEDGCKISGLQIAVCVQKEDNGEKGVTFFSLSNDFRDNDEWLFKVSGKAERVSEPVDEYLCACGYGWNRNRVIRHHFCPNCGKAVTNG